MNFEMMYTPFGCFLSKTRGNVYRHFVKYSEHIGYRHCENAPRYVEGNGREISLSIQQSLFLIKLTNGKHYRVYYCPRILISGNIKLVQ